MAAVTFLLMRFYLVVVVLFLFLVISCLFIFHIDSNVKKINFLKFIHTIDTEYLKKKRKTIHSLRGSPSPMFSAALPSKIIEIFSLYSALILTHTPLSMPPPHTYLSQYLHHTLTSLNASTTHLSLPMPPPHTYLY
jgi:hypothetical protein